MRLDPVQHHMGVAGAFAMAFNMLALLWVAYGMSNYREVRALRQLQRHALVYYYKFDVQRVAPAREAWWPVALCRRIGLLHSPPVVDGWVVEPVVGNAPVPNIGYHKNFVAWRAYISPRQLHVELAILAAEQVLVLGVFGFLLPLTGLIDSVLEPVLRPLEPADV